MEPKTCISFNKKVFQNDNGFVVEILPHDSHVSFYGKAHALFTPFYTALLSYKTPILVYRVGTTDAPSDFIRLYDGGYEVMRYYWGMRIPDYSDDVSATTLRHIKAFCGMNKKEFLSLPFDGKLAEHWTQAVLDDCRGWLDK